MTRTQRLAILGAVVTTALFWAPIFRDYGILAGLFWLAVTYLLLALVIWAAGSSTKDPHEDSYICRDPYCDCPELKRRRERP
jgi:hypothetical protein